MNILTNYCCFLTGPVNETTQSNKCVWIQPATIQTTTNTWMLDDKSYNVTCDISEGALGTPCSMTGPTKKEDCSIASSETNSCCYYSSQEINYCFWMGSKVEGQILPTVMCGSSILSVSLIFTIVIAFLFN